MGTEAFVNGRRVAPLASLRRQPTFVDLFAGCGGGELGPDAGRVERGRPFEYSHAVPLVEPLRECIL